MAGTGEATVQQTAQPSPVVDITSSPDLPHEQPRRSTRVRNRPPPLAAAQNAPSSPAVSDRLEQIGYCSATDLGIDANDPDACMQVRLHPVAAMLMSVHSHLTRTEVIGYLGGTIHSPDDRPTEQHVVIVEAFAARAVTDRALARTGRSAYREVEIDPESSVEVMALIQSKGLEVVGWYHSHPDASFTVEPSRVDIENQDNYQKHIFREKPFVAAIIAPYNEDLPDYSPALEFFRVFDGEIPLRLPYVVDTMAAIPSRALPVYWPEEEPSKRRYPLLELEQECFTLIDEHKRSAKRMRLGQEWRPPYSFVDKLRFALLAIAHICGGPKPPVLVDEDSTVVASTDSVTASASNGQSASDQPETEVSRFLACAQRVVDHVEIEYSTAAEMEEEEREVRRQRKKARKARKRS